MDDRTAVADILAIANAGPSGKRIVNCGGNTLNTPYKAGLTTLQSGTAVVCMSSANYGTILYVAAGTDAVFLRPKVDGTWKDWERLLTNADLIHGNTDAFSIPANSERRITVDLSRYNVGTNYRLYAVVRGSTWANVGAIYCNNNQTIIDTRNLNSTAVNISLWYTVIRK